EPVDHDDGRLAAAAVDIVDALAVDFHELAARRQHGLDATRSVARKPDQTGDDEREEQNQSEKEGHGKLPSSGFKSKKQLHRRNVGASAERALCARILPAEDQHAIIDLAETKRHHVLGVVLVELPRPL